ncbi:MerR family transcriptional regulator [Canibacter zhoujuaniae]|uniref:transcriptional regulator FtsR n=1 Tax=Canibacter zhoujuaniae TaxID=2708343 RepID=UPI001420B614|nr:MerR family transcriptional regulator [Canibacter zhoujuaniae]
MVKLTALRAQATDSSTQLFTIGQVEQLLKRDFSDLSASKLRYLQDRGVVDPLRTPSGYRKYTQAHIERLRQALVLQRDYFMPIDKIVEYFTELDAGGAPQLPGGAQEAPSIFSPHPVLNREELLRITGAPAKLLAEAISAGLLPAAEVYPADAVKELEAIMRMAEAGLTPRHLRALRLGAEKDAEVIRHTAIARKGKAPSPERSEFELQLASHYEVLRAAVMRRALKRR